MFYNHVHVLLNYKLNFLLLRLLFRFLYFLYYLLCYFKFFHFEFHLILYRLFTPLNFIFLSFIIILVFFHNDTHIEKRGNESENRNNVHFVLMLIIGDVNTHINKYVLHQFKINILIMFGYVREMFIKIVHVIIYIPYVTNYIDKIYSFFFFY